MAEADMEKVLKADGNYENRSQMLLDEAISKPSHRTSFFSTVVEPRGSLGL